MNLEHTFSEFELLWDKFSYQIEVTSLFDEDDGDIIEAFLQQYDFSEDSLLFDTFRFHYLCFKTAYTQNTLPF